MTMPNDANAEAAGLDQILALKKAKVVELRGRGLDPYPARSVKTHTAAEALKLGAGLAVAEHGTAEVVCAGRLVTMRDMGKSIFGHLLDSSGRIQVYFKKEALSEAEFALVKHDIHAGDFIGVSGQVFKTKTGEITIAVKSVTLLSKALRPLPEKWHGLKDVETRYRARHLDLIANPDVFESFRKRSLIISTVRKTMDELGFIEVETPILLSQAGGASARPFETFHNALQSKMVLRIATELYLKRLIIGGMDKVYEIGRIFRNEGIDTRHNPEFTMMEAYEAYSDYEGMARLFEKVLSNCADALGISEVEFEGKKLNLRPPFARVDLPELWQKRCGEKIDAILSGKGFNRKGLESLAGRLGLAASADTPSAKIFEHIFDAKILPELEQITFVFNHPTAITPLAKLMPGTESLVERFEAFAAGKELANAYSELNDPEDQRDRLKEQVRQKAEEKNAEADILDEDFVQALECGMPPTGGIGIGIDRLVMILTGQASIREVILFPTLKTTEQGSGDRSEG